MFASFKYGLRTGLKQWRTALIAYVFQLLIAIPLGIQVYQVFEASIGNSLEISKLLKGYNDTVATDFFNVHGASLSPLLGQLRWVLLVYLIFGIFVNAGILYAVVKEKSGWKIFWEGGATYFFKFLKIALFFILIAVVLTGAIWLPFLGFFQKSAEVFSSEKISVFLLIGVAFFYFIGLIFLFNWSVVARLKVMTEEIKNWEAIKKGFRFSVRRFLPLAGLFLLFLFLQLILIIIYWQLESALGMTSVILIFVFFVLQQLLIFSRWIFKVAMYGGVNNFHFNKN